MQQQPILESADASRSFDGVMRVLKSDGSMDPQRAVHVEVATLVEIYEQMVRIRIIDASLVRLQRQGRVGFHVGSEGEEATIIASTAALRDNDWVVPCYRELGALLYRGYPLQGVIDNMFGNADDASVGRQMPDHYVSREHRYLSVSAPIGTHIPHAVGIAWAARRKGHDDVAVAYFGDGATSSEGFHAAMNFAAVMKSPTVFLLRNNQFAISTPIEKQTRCEILADKAIAYGMPASRCDGNDALAVFATVRDAVERAARGEGPTLVEMLTYRTGGHSTSDDPRAYRSDEEVERWRADDCPLERLRVHLVRRGAWDDARDASHREACEAEIKACIVVAEAKAPPSLESMFEGVFREQPWHLREQREECVKGPRAPQRHGGK